MTLASSPHGVLDVSNAGSASVNFARSFRRLVFLEIFRSCKLKNEDMIVSA